jgi:LPXTG-site transpeptidase (sortase) family protein
VSSESGFIGTARPPQEPAAERSAIDVDAAGPNGVLAYPPGSAGTAPAETHPAQARQVEVWRVEAASAEARLVQVLSVDGFRALAWPVEGLRAGEERVVGRPLEEWRIDPWHDETDPDDVSVGSDLLVASPIGNTQQVGGGAGPIRTEAGLVRTEAGLVRTEAGLVRATTGLVRAVNPRPIERRFDVDVAPSYLPALEVPQRRRLSRGVLRGLEAAAWVGCLGIIVAIAVVAAAGARAPGRPQQQAGATQEPASCAFGACEPAPLSGPPTRVRIPAIDVESPLETLHLDRAGALQPPKAYERAGWYGEGILPGENGAAVIAGHVDSYNGPGVFYKLHTLRAGDTIEVQRGGQWITFRVTHTEQYPKNEFPTDHVYRLTPGAELRLITCGGTFDRTRLSYRDNIVVYAVIVRSKSTPSAVVSP